MYFNVRSLLPKIDNLRAICLLYQPCIICIVESWLDETILDSEIAIQGYSHCRLDRNRHGGGILIFVNTAFINYSVLFKGTPSFEFLIVSIHLGQCPDIVIALFYRPPNSCITLLDLLLSTLCNSFVSCPSKLCLLGDFNINYLDKNTPLYNKLLSLVSSFCLTQIVNEPTRVTLTSETLIDLFFVSPTIVVQSCITIPPLANADHLGLSIKLSLAAKNFKPSTSLPRKIWRYSRADWDRAIELIDCIEWDSLLQKQANEYWCTWKNDFLQIMEMSIPHATARVKTSPPWINRKILNAIKKRDRLC